METIEASATTLSQSIAVDHSFANEVFQAGLSESAENELMGAYARCRKNGYASWHTEVLHHNHSSKVRREVIGFANKSGVFRKSKKFLPDSHCNEYVFSDKFDPEKTPPTLCQNLATYKTPLPRCLSPSSPLPPLPSSLLFPLPSSWLFCRNRNWVALCKKKNWTIPVDYHGDSVICRAVFRALDELELPGDAVLEELSPIRKRADRLSPREVGRNLLERAQSGKVVRKLKIKNNTCYHFVSNMPKVMRRSCKFGTEAIAESDIPSSYLCHLAGQVSDQAEKQRMVGMLPSFYEWIDDACPRKFERTDEGDEQQADFDALPMEERRDAVKREVQRQLLFGLHWQVRARPMWKPFRKEFPIHAAMINEKRKRWGGASGFARYLMRLQGDTMNAAMMDLIGQGITMLPLSDGLLVPEPFIEHAGVAIENAAEAALGFRPVVRRK